MTVITADMIKHSGVRTLKDALILFVPGYTESEDRNEVVFSTRGIYATSQQKVLVMINGHRINSRSYLTAVPGYGIALHNIERIEILRGPGSSLYGNVALSGVVNLITKKGKDFNANSIEYGTGNHGQNCLRMMTGAGGQDWDVLAWGQYYNATGQIHTLNGSEPFNAGKNGEIRMDLFRSLSPRGRCRTLRWRECDLRLQPLPHIPGHWPRPRPLPATFGCEV